MEVLHPGDVTIENSGTVIDGVRQFPRAVPSGMFRIFRTKFETLEQVWAEIERVKIVSKYLAPDFIAHSTEFVVEYHGPQGPELMLCGFQEYIEGEILDPWTILDAANLLPTIYTQMRDRGASMSLSRGEWVADARKKGSELIDRFKRMITHGGYIPDLAGVGNLMITAYGEVCLVDINNISPIHTDSTIPLDEKGYPVCDKSIEAIALIEEKIVGRPINMEEKLYQLFLTPQRKRRVKEKLELFSKKFKESKAADIHHSQCG
ncbi:MAG: hypothetical protein ACWGOX_14195 [Desulforhopalus sp.]